MRSLPFVAAALIALGAACAPAGAVTLESIGSFDEPIYVTSDPGDANRLFVAERGGTIELVEGGSAVLFADLGEAVGCDGEPCDDSTGLLSIALAPDFGESGRLYADYASETDEAIHVVELVAAGGSALGATPRELLEVPHPGSTSHYGGQLQIGPEGDLFVSTGDGGGKYDEFHNAQDLESLLGKILRIRPTEEGEPTYTVPGDNPFVGKPGRDEIWSYGLRNPFRFSFDEGGGGGLWIGDVGQSSREEIDFAPAPGRGAGANFGWNCLEGSEPGPATDPGCKSLGPGDLTAPVFEYPHEDPGGGAAHGCAVIGGYVVRDPGLGGLDGRYLYGDLCGGRLRSFSPLEPAATDCFEGIAVPNLNSFGEDAADRLYTVSGNGDVSRLVNSDPSTCGEPEAATPAPPRSVYAGIKAFRRRVQRGGRALITVWISPCAGRQGERIELFRGRTSLGSRRLSRACTASFRPRIRQRASFRARIEAGDGFGAATSRRLTIKPRHVRRRHHVGHRRARQ